MQGFGVYGVGLRGFSVLRPNKQLRHVQAEPCDSAHYPPWWPRSLAAAAD